MTANPSSDYETCALSLAWSAMGLDGVKVLMMLEMKILKVMVAVVIMVLVQSVSVTILDTVPEVVVVVNMIVHDDATLKMVLSMDVIAIVRGLGSGMKKDSV